MPCKSWKGYNLFVLCGRRPPISLDSGRPAEDLRQWDFRYIGKGISLELAPAVFLFFCFSVPILRNNAKRVLLGFLPSVEMTVTLAE
ncbi:MAG TPA: hypothetical protein PKM51_05235 [Chitinophagales bacterium]|nr:hypothetical protein [Chitinophagales bacterium]